jgi:hypothetical protein
MKPSRLQVGPGTVILINETKLREGTLNANGVRSVKALQSVISNQLLPIEFEYSSSIKVPTDVCIIVLSNQPSILCDGMLKLYSQTAKFAAQTIQHCDFPPSEVTASVAMECDDGITAISMKSSLLLPANTMRMWWATCRTSDASLSDEMIGFAETDFVSARQKKIDDNLVSVANEVACALLSNPFSLFNDPTSRIISDCFQRAEVVGYRVDGVDFHNWLTLSRLCAVGTGSNIDVNIWKYVRCLVLIRQGNLQVSLGGASLYQ